MIKKIKQFIKSFFSSTFVHPVIDEPLQTAIHDKLDKRRKDTEKETEKHVETLNNYLRTYFSTTYVDNKEMALAFTLTNKKWKQLCREVNGKSKLINLNPKAFENRVKATITQLNENKEKKKTE